MQTTAKETAQLRDINRKHGQGKTTSIYFGVISSVILHKDSIEKGW